MAKTAPSPQLDNSSGRLELPLPGIDNIFPAKDYTKMPSNQTIVRDLNCSKEHLLSGLKCGGILNPGDPNIAPHEFVALGMVRKTFPYNMIE
jgi:hypothetical protein